MTTGKFTLVIRWPSGQSTICGEMTDHQHGEICRILSPDYRAQLPSQGGEAVEVVAYIDGGGAIYTAKLLEIMSVEPDGCEPLMTVAQHKRILAAATHPADQVADDLTMVKVPRELLEEIVELHRRRGVVLIIHVEQLAELLNGDRE